MSQRPTVLLNALKLDEGPAHHLGGNYFMVENLLRAMARAGTVDLAVLADEYTAGPLRTAAPTAEIIFTPLRNGGVLAADLAVVRMVRARRPTVYHRPTGQLPFWFLPCRTVATITDLNFQALPTPPLKRLYKEASYRWTVRRADKITCISEYTRGEVIRRLGGDPGKVRAVLLGANELAPADPALAASIGGDFWLTFGHQAHKNVEACLAALARPGRAADRLVVVGRSPHVDEVLKPEVARLGLDSRVVFAGAVSASALRGLYERARGLLFLSRYEGFGLPVLEAMSAGCPVICSRVCSLPEVAGDAARMVDADNVPEVVAAMAEVDGHPATRREMVAAGRAQAGRFTWEKAAAQTLEIYAELARSAVGATGEGRR